MEDKVLLAIEEFFCPPPGKVPDRRAAQEALKLSAQHGIPLGHICRDLVKDIDLLKQFLSSSPKIEDRDFASMLCRCVEQGRYDAAMLLVGRGGNKKTPLMLLPGKYEIDTKTYNLVKTRGYRDLFYEGLKTDYDLPTPKESLEKERYFSYRQAYHLMLYGGANKRKGIMDWWKHNCFGERGFFGDCTYEAVCDYLKIEITRTFDDRVMKFIEGK